MSTKNFFCLLFLVMPALAGRASAQSDSSSAVTIIPAIRGWGEFPLFSPFRPDWVWLRGRPFDLVARQFVSDNLIFSYIPRNARRLRSGNNLREDTYLWWEADPYTDAYYWATDLQHDNRVVWRYDRQNTRIDSFTTFSAKTPAIIGKPGIWVKDSQSLVLLDRSTGQVLRRIADRNTDFGNWSGHFQTSDFIRVDDQVRGDYAWKALRPWGDDVLVNDLVLYQNKTNRYVPFFPLPTDMEGCKSPMGLEFKAEVCASRVPDDHNKFPFYVAAPGQNALKLSVDLTIAPEYLLAANFPFAWFSSPGKLIAFNFLTGDSLEYAGNTDWPLRGNQNNRYMGFGSKRGLSFFDKYRCQFGVLELPAGYQEPRNFTADEHYIYLTYNDHWEIVDFSRLSTAFSRDLEEEEYKTFEQQEQQTLERLQIMPMRGSSFYARYQTYIQLRDRYRSNPNRKIAERISSFNRGYNFSSMRDTSVERIATDFEAGRFDPSVSCHIAQALFRYWGLRGNLQKVLHLLETPENKSCIEQESPEFGSNLVDVIRSTQQSLDSVAKLTLAPDAYLYAVGKIRLDYGFHTGYFILESFSHRVGNLEPAFNDFRSLIQMYPNSPWADQAAYHLLTFTGSPSSTDHEDDLPPGGNREAYQAFTSFLTDYPHSDRRPDMLLRLARLIQTGTEDNEGKKVNKNVAGEYLKMIARDYPVFADTAADYPQAVERMNEHAWLNTWALQTTFDKTKYQPEDSIRVSIRIVNRSGETQTLDTTFLRHWQEGLWLRLFEVRDQDCRKLWGYFPLRQEPVTAKTRPIIL
ncbi:MAG: hypothetical protein ABIO24_03750, partial [Saprospiraceae bacterium]